MNSEYGLVIGFVNSEYGLGFNIYLGFVLEFKQIFLSNLSRKKVLNLYNARTNLEHP